MTGEAVRVDLKLNAKKCKTMRTKDGRSEKRIIFHGQRVEEVEVFQYLGATVDIECCWKTDITNIGCIEEGARRGIWELEI